MARLKLGMVGGGQGAFIGGVHRIASRIDNHYELVAGSLASNPEIANVSAKELGINDDRSYARFQDMAEKESLREDRIDVVAIVKPNFLNYPISEAILSKNISFLTCFAPITVFSRQSPPITITSGPISLIVSSSSEVLSKTTTASTDFSDSNMYIRSSCVL